MQTYFQFGGQATLHQRVANEYRMISKDATLTLAKYEDQLVTLQDVADKVNDLSVHYNQVCASEQDCPTSPSDYRKARKGIEKEENYTTQELNLAGNNNG